MLDCIYEPLCCIITQITQIITKWGSRGCYFYPFSVSYTMKFQVKYNKKMTPLEPWIGSFFFKSTLFLQISCLYIYDLPMTPIFLFYYYIVSILSNQDDSLQITIYSTDTFIFCSLSYNYSINNVILQHCITFLIIPINKQLFSNYASISLII